ncbi:methyltransferase domain-containing protein [Kitasatospora sp. NPDC002040]|uniref:methyltransferase domain-containing protein n=1 Tax=Kitasatospora sp. NPDC002040 TaxID=3154661 RepID=UPI00331A4D5F
MTTTVDFGDTRARRDALADRLATAGHGREWTEAVRAVPRHLFVPEFYEQDPAGHWRPVRSGDTGYLDGVYSDRALTTQVTEGLPTSSSSEPDLMLTMLEALDLEAGQRVYECGLGTGWNAGLMTHRVGDQNVTSVDIDADLTGPATRRLARAGYRPHVRTGDGVVGAPDRAPFDRFIATCGLQSIPRPWLAQAARDAVVVAPIGWGLVQLTVHGDEAHGRFLPQGAHFMARRSTAAKPRFDELNDAPTRRTTVTVEAVERLEFPLSLALPGHQWCTWSDGEGTLSAVGIWTPDGSTAIARADGTVRQIGPRRLGDTVGELQHAFSSSAPNRADFGLTVTPEQQRVWWGDPGHLGWDLPELVFTP